MRFPLSALCLLFTCVVHASEAKRSDAQTDDFVGPVKSVRTMVKLSGVKWQQPGGPTLVLPIWCHDCEYDRDGFRTKSGQTTDGHFRGEIAELVRNESGGIDRFVFDASTGQLDRHEVMGRFGKTEETDYVDGKLRWRQKYSYDQYGHLAEWLTLDSTGKQESRNVTKREPDGTLREESVWGKIGELRYQHTLDSQSKVERFTTFDQSGQVTLSLMVIGGKLASFWKISDSQEFGDNFMETWGEGDQENYACHKDGTCDVSRVHYDYLDADKRNPVSAEWRDSEGNLRLAAYYEYQTDSFRNWTRRLVWVWSPDLNERKLYETDSRVIDYWPK